MIFMAGALRNVQSNLTLRCHPNTRISNRGPRGKERGDFLWVIFSRHGLRDFKSWSSQVRHVSFQATQPQHVNPRWRPEQYRILLCREGAPPLAHGLVQMFFRNCGAQLPFSAVRQNCTGVRINPHSLGRKCQKTRLILSPEQ